MKKIIKVALLALTATALFSCGNGKQSSNSGTWTVQFMLNNGTEDIYKEIVVENNKTITESIADPTRNGYTFDGWYVDQACTVYFDESGDTVTSDMKVYAKWAASGIANPDTPGQGDSSDVGGDNGDVNEFVLPDGATTEAPTEGYALFITTADGNEYYYPLTPGEEFEGFSQHVGSGVTLNEGDLIKLYDGTNSACWAEDNLNPYSIEGCFTASSEGITVNTTGEYDVYAKFKYEQDEVYIGPAGA